MTQTRRMKKIEPVIDPAALEAVKLHLVEAGIDGRLTVMEVTGIENLGRFYELQRSSEDQWMPRLKLDLIVSDRQAHAAVNMILQYANLVASGGSGGHINILPLDATLEIGVEKLPPPSKEKRSAKRSAVSAGATTQESAKIRVWR